MRTRAPSATLKKTAIEVAEMSSTSTATVAILDVADDRVFPDLKDDDPSAARAVGDQQLGSHRIEHAHADDGLEIAPHHGLAVKVAGLALHAIKNRLSGDAAVAADFDVFDDRAVLGQRQSRQGEDGQHGE